MQQTVFSRLSGQRHNDAENACVVQRSAVRTKWRHTTTPTISRPVCLSKVGFRNYRIEVRINKIKLRE